MSVDASMLLSFLGGLGLFLFGIRFMSRSMQQAAGPKLRSLLARLTSNPIAGVMTGAVVTMGVQSSSATTVMVVGLVNAGLMTLPQAIGVIMGANIGTSFTAQLIAFNLTDLSLPAIALGSFAVLFAQRRLPRNVGQCILGFGVLFLGLSIMQETAAPLRHQHGFQNLMLAMSDHPIWGLLVGLAMTVVLQSSSGTIGILQGFAQQGVITLPMALPILIGDNIGTTVTALLASLGTSIAARRAALSHTFFNLVGAVIFFAVMPLFAAMIVNTSPEPMRQIANAHTLFNTLNTVVQLPFIYLLARLVTFLIPGEAVELPHGPQYLSDSLLEAPEMATVQVRRELGRMADLAAETLDDAMEFFLHGTRQTGQNALKKEEVVNELETAITRYLVRLSRQDLTQHLSHELNALLNIAHDVERVGDHAENVVELAEEKFDGRLPFSDQAIDDALKIYSQVKGTLDMARALIQDPTNLEMAEAIVASEEEVDVMEEDLRSRHILRLNSGECYPESGVIFLDMLSNLERVADHASSIAFASLDNVQD
ncbi:MAG: Na/Pi cotransporter family protein [Bacillota bacterium]